MDGSPAPGGINVSSPDDPFERAAEQPPRPQSLLPRQSPTPGQGAGPSAQGDWVQRQAGISEEELEEEETAQGDWVQRQTGSRKRSSEEEETAQGDWVQRQTEDEELEEEEMGTER